MRIILLLSLLIVWARSGSAVAQTIQLGEVLIVGEPTLTDDADLEDFEALFASGVAPAWKMQMPGTELHLFRADRGERSGKYLVASSATRDAFSGSDAPQDLLGNVGASEYVREMGGATEYVLIGSDVELPRVELLGIHTMQVEPGRETAFEHFVRDSVYAALKDRTPGMHLIYYKGARGENAGTYVTLYAIESVTARERYWPTGAPETQALKAAFRPHGALADRLSAYLVEGSYLEPSSGGAAAIFESLDWTDYLHVDAERSHLDDPPPGFVSLFDGESLGGWQIPEGDNGHWKVVDGVIDYDAESESSGDKSLWTDRAFEDFVLYVDWRIKETPWDNHGVPLIMPSGLHKLDENGQEIRMTVPDSDSGILFRGPNRAQANIWCWPIGSGEVYGYRMDPEMPPDVRAGATPITNADQNIGEWNTFKITVEANVLTVELNGSTVIDRARLPGLPERGPIGLQHHGSKANGKWVSPPSLVQFRRIFVKEL